MRIIFLFVLLSFYFAADYQSIQFRRDGGGNFYFDLHLVQEPHLINIQTTQYEFKPLSKNFYIKSTDDYKYFDKLLKGKVKVNKGLPAGDGKALTGTWLKVYLIGPKKITEITDDKVLEKFKAFEGTVKAKL